jgi:hypothetical protein
MSSITQAEVAALLADPAKLLEELAKWRSIRDEAESKLRAAVDEDSARHLKEVAEKGLLEASLRIEKIDAECLQRLEDAARAASGLTDGAQVQAAQILDDARAEAAAILGAAAAKLAAAAEKEGRVDDALAKAAGSEDEARRQAERNARAAEAHERAARGLADARKRLSSLVRGMREIVGDEG